MAFPQPEAGQTVRCVLCQGGQCLASGDLHNFKLHLEAAHSAVFDLDFLVSIAFLEREERARIVETVYPRVKKYFQTLRAAPKKTPLSIEKRLLEDLEEEDAKRRKVNVNGSKYAAVSLSEEQEEESTEASGADIPEHGGSHLLEDKESSLLEDKESSLLEDKEVDNSLVKAAEETFEGEKTNESRCDICEKPMLKKSIRKHKQRVHQLYENMRSSIFNINGSVSEDVTATDPVIVPEPRDDIETEEREAPVKHNPGTVSCGICSKQIKKKNLKRHMSAVHNDRDNEDDEDIVAIDIDEDQKCRICQEQFSVLDKLKEHVKNVHDIDYDDLERCEAQDELEFNFNSTTESLTDIGDVKEYQCDQCEASYAVKDSLRRHKRKKH